MLADLPTRRIMRTMAIAAGIDPTATEERFGDVVRGAARFVETELEHAADRIDARGCALVDGKVRVPAELESAWRAYVDHGWPGLTLPAEQGGQDAAELLQAPLSEMVNGACLPLGMMALLARAAAKTIVEHGDQGLRSAYGAKLATGEWGASICMTEPDAGSDAGALRCAASPAAGGAYRLTGTKIFISFGDHPLTDQIAHMVLARAADAPAGIGLFLVPARLLDSAGRPGIPNAVRVRRIEEKLGLHGSPTCELEFDGAEGHPVGPTNKGFRTIFTMVNTMRLDVALQGVGLAAQATGRALAYAERRRQGSVGGERVPIAGHPDVRATLMRMIALTEASRLLCYEAAGTLDRAAGAAEDRERAEAADLASWLLPICKAGCSDMAVGVTSDAIQVFGGHGYIRDNGVERLFREARITPIYEGTNGIQAIDLVFRKLADGKGRRFELFARRIEADLAAAADRADLATIREAVAGALNAARAVSGRMRDLAETAPRDALAGASTYLELVFRTALGWSWLRFARADDPSCAGRDTALANFYAGRFLADIDVLARRCLAGAGGLDALSDDQLRQGIAAD